MLKAAKSLALASLLLALVAAPGHAAEREDVRKAINLVTSVKMPYPENLARTAPRRSACGSSVMVNHWVHQARGSALVL